MPGFAIQHRLNESEERGSLAKKEKAYPFMWPLILISIYSLLIVSASLLGGILPTRFRLTHTVTQTMMSFVGGLMLGVALLHLLPHATAESGSLDGAVGWALGGLLAMFFLMRVSQFHHHEHAVCDDHGDEHAATPHTHAGPHEFSWLGLFGGLALHTLIDGMALAASVAAGGGSGVSAGLIGGGTFLAIVLHKPLDALSITSLMLSAKWSPGWVRAVNLLFGLMCPLGALLFYVGVQNMGEMRDTVVGSALGFAAGVFLCISLADILPEVQFHQHDRFKLSAWLLFGVGLAYAIGYLEPAHQHTIPSSGSHADHGHSHDHAP